MPGVNITHVSKLGWGISGFSGRKPFGFFGSGWMFDVSMISMIPVMDVKKRGLSSLQ